MATVWLRATGRREGHRRHPGRVVRPRAVAVPSTVSTRTATLRVGAMLNVTGTWMVTGRVGLGDRHVPDGDRAGRPAGP